MSAITNSSVRKHGNSCQGIPLQERRSGRRQTAGGRRQEAGAEAGAFSIFHFSFLIFHLAHFSDSHFVLLRVISWIVCPLQNRER